MTEDPLLAEVTALHADGLSYAQIAERTGLTYSQVKSLRAKALSATGKRGRPQASYWTPEADGLIRRASAERRLMPEVLADLSALLGRKITIGAMANRCSYLGIMQPPRTQQAREWRVNREVERGTTDEALRFYQRPFVPTVEDRVRETRERFPVPPGGYRLGMSVR
jgi:hypothetical protein